MLNKEENATSMAFVPEPTVTPDYPSVEKQTSSPNIENSSLESSIEALSIDTPTDASSLSCRDSTHCTAAPPLHPFYGPVPDPVHVPQTPLTDLPPELVELILEWAITSKGPPHYWILLEYYSVQGWTVSSKGWNDPCVSRLRVVCSFFRHALDRLLGILTEVQLHLGADSGASNPPDLSYSATRDPTPFNIAPYLPLYLRQRATRFKIISYQICALYNPPPPVSVAGLPQIDRIVLSPLDVAYTCKCFERRLIAGPGMTPSFDEAIVTGFARMASGWPTPPLEEVVRLCRSRGALDTMRHLIRSWWNNVDDVDVYVALAGYFAMQAVLRAKFTVRGFHREPKVEIHLEDLAAGHGTGTEYVCGRLVKESARALEWEVDKLNEARVRQQKFNGVSWDFLAETEGEFSHQESLAREAVEWFGGNR